MTSTMNDRSTTTTADPDLRVETTDDLSGDEALRPIPGGPLVPQPLRAFVSGRYRRSTGLVHPIGLPLSPAQEPAVFIPNPGGPVLPIGNPSLPVLPTDRIPVPGRPVVPVPWQAVTEELRLDVDGRYPQMVVSGELRQRLVGRCSWIAHLTPRAAGGWEGDITYTHGTLSLMPFTHVQVAATHHLFGTGSATVVYSGGVSSASTRSYDFASGAFHDIELEYDRTSDSGAVTQFATSSHPNRPATLPAETLSIETVYARAGFRVTKSGGDDVVPVSRAGSDAKWTNQEMHDAMQTYWSRFANVAQWSVWTLFAGQSSRGRGLGGIMFDDIGTAQRQGCAVFSDSFISDPPAGDPNGTAFVNRMRFWTAVHEIGHTFNLAHAWQKSLGGSYGNPWVPMADEPEARSFMNYPYNVAGGSTAFFANFDYRFSDSELLYLRHAPSEFVQQGNAAWFTDHGFEQAAVSAEPALGLTVRAQRPSAVFEFLEPVVVELRLANLTDHPLVVDKNLLAGNLTLLARNRRGAATVVRSFAQQCLRAEPVALMPGEAIYSWRDVSASRTGAEIADPGYYTLQAALHLPDEDVVSGEFRIKVSPPMDRAAEVLAPDVLTEDVRRVLAFGGSRVLTEANDVLREVVERMEGTAVATQAAFALARPGATTRLVLKTPTDKPSDMKIGTESGEAADADALIELVGDQGTADTLGHLGLHRDVADVVERLAEEGRREDAAKLQGALVDTMSSRGVKDSVLTEMKATRDDLRKNKK